MLNLHRSFNYITAVEQDVHASCLNLSCLSIPITRNFKDFAAFISLSDSFWFVSILSLCLIGNNGLKVICVCYKCNQVMQVQQWCYCLRNWASLNLSGIWMSFWGKYETELELAIVNLKPNAQSFVMRRP